MYINGQTRVLCKSRLILSRLNGPVEFYCTAFKWGGEPFQLVKSCFYIVIRVEICSYLLVSITT